MGTWVPRVVQVIPKKKLFIFKGARGGKSRELQIVIVNYQLPLVFLVMLVEPVIKGPTIDYF